MPESGSFASEPEARVWLAGQEPGPRVRPGEDVDATVRRQLEQITSLREELLRAREREAALVAERDRLAAEVERVRGVCTRLTLSVPDPTEVAVAHSQGWNDALDAVTTALDGIGEA
ncbi:hypothetical protein ABZ746_37500 [Streptomyces sp. NPDC020096]